MRQTWCPLSASACNLVPRVFAGSRQLSAGPRSFPTLSPRIFSQMLGPIPRQFLWCIYSFLPKEQRPSPTWERLGTQQFSHYNSCTKRFSGLQSFSNVQASRFACHPGCTYRNRSMPVRQPWLLLPRISRFVASPSSGYASRPFRAIDGMGTFTPLDSQPCRLLPQAPAWESSLASSSFLLMR
jgi:hypothetical protein